LQALTIGQLLQTWWAMANYEVLSKLWSPSQNKDIEPGEVVDLDDDIAILLLKQKCIKPAVISRKQIRDYEVKNDTDNG